MNGMSTAYVELTPRSALMKGAPRGRSKLSDSPTTNHDHALGATAYGTDSEMDDGETDADGELDMEASVMGNSPQKQRGHAVVLERDDRGKYISAF